MSGGSSPPDTGPLASRISSPRPWGSSTGVGAKSGQQLAGRAGAAVAGRLGIAPVTFPGDHGGFLGGEYGQTGEPDAFAATLREVLTA